MAVESIAAPPAAAAEQPFDPDARPTTPLAWTSLIQISMYWFALNAIWGGFELFQQERTKQLLGQEGLLAVGAMDILAAPIALLTMPVVGSMSDYVGTRFGRRKPFILVGSLLAAASLAGLAMAPSFILLMVFFLCLQFTANVARGPFAGLVPDLVPDKQVGVASGLMGLMIVAGLVGGFRAGDHVVQRVALDGLAAGRPDEAPNGAGRHGLGRAGAGHVVNPLFLHRAVQVIDAEPQRDLRRFDAGRDPERLHVRDIVEHQP